MMLLPYENGLIVTTPFDRECARLADRHYSRRTVGARQFAYNGRKLVLRDALGLVVFVWMFPDESMRMDGQHGYNNALFRNESDRVSSEIILEAEHKAIEKWGANRVYTYIDPSKLRTLKCRGREFCRWPVGRCFLEAGWRFVRIAKSGKHLFEKQIA